MISEESGASAICKELLTDIRFGRLAPGDALPSEHEIMGRFEVSRSMVRDAVAMLTGMGVLDRSRGRRGIIQRVDGAAISRLFPLMLNLSGRESIGDVYEMRTLIEGEATALACRRGDDEALQEIHRLAQAYAEAQQQRDLPSEQTEDEQFIKLDTEFHAAIARASGNGMFEHLLEALTSFLHYVQVESCRSDPVRSGSAADEHLRIAAAIQERDPDAARIEMIHHLRLSREALARKMEASEE